MVGAFGLSGMCAGRRQKVAIDGNAADESLPKGLVFLFIAW